MNAAELNKMSFNKLSTLSADAINSLPESELNKLDFRVLNAINEDEFIRLSVKVFEGISLWNLKQLYLKKDMTLKEYNTELVRENLYKFTKLVKRMRDTQKEYSKTRNKELIPIVEAQEFEVDGVIELIIKLHLSRHDSK